MANIAFLGTGTMGLEMALNLLGAGHQLTVYNRTTSRTAPLVDAGATAASSPAQAVGDAEFIICIVGDDEASSAIWLGPDGVLAGKPAAGTIAVESSTLSRQWVMELDATLREAGLRYIDCPVTGGPDGARNRTLTLLTGAVEQDLAEAWPVLSAYSRRYIHFGPVGSGTAYKLIVNLIGAVQGAALAEGMALAERAGLDPATVSQALGSGAVASPHVKYMAERIVHDYHDDVYFSARWRHKDAQYALRLAAELGMDMPTSTEAEKLYQKALDEGLGDKNSSVIFKLLH
jgi:3-hydroxyisobutyrate dehydrogenase